MQVFMYVILGTQELETKVELAGLALYLHSSRGLSLCAAGTMTTYKVWLAGMPQSHMLALYWQRSWYTVQ